MSDLECWVWFSGLQCLRFRTRQALLDRYGSAKELWFSDPREIEALGGLLPEERRALLERDPGGPERIVRRCAEQSIRIVTYQDAAYPQRLRSIPDPPYALYVLGNLPPVDTLPLIAVVGTRRCSPYGERITRKLSWEIARCGGVVVTGLAAGIDSHAAEGALDAGGTVVGVLGVAINRVYPRENEALYARVTANGALVSEYPPDAEGSREWFPQRNRIIAGLSLGTVVAEAPLRSGALITAHRALDYGRDVFAAPSDAERPKGMGSNRLIREGAALVSCGWDVMQEYEAQFPGHIERAETEPVPPAVRAEQSVKEKPQGGEKKTFSLRALFRGGESARTARQRSDILAEQLEALNENQLKIVGCMDRPSMHVDDIIDLTKLPASVVLSELTMLQIRGYVAQESGKRFTLNLDK